MRSSTEKGKELEDLIESFAKRHGWSVEKRKRYRGKIVDLLIRKKGITFVVQCKNTEMAMPSHVTQAKKDYEEYVRFLLEEKLGLSIRPVLVSNGFSKGAKKRAKSYDVMLYNVEDFKRLLAFSKKEVRRYL
jgi:hypothetical protein